MTFIAGVFRPGGNALEVCSALQQSVPIAQERWRALSVEDFSLAVLPSHRLPEDIFDRQPLQSHGLLLAGDIRIDNRDELAARLGWSSGETRLGADSALFLAAWERWGEETLRYVVGGFAVAIWKIETRELTLIRDHVGERSLYFLHSGDEIAFASLPGPLRAFPGIDTSLDEDRIVQYLAILPGTRGQTFFRNIQQLPVAHLLHFKAGNAALRRYWHPLDAPQTRFKTNDQYIEAFRERFDLAVGARLRTTGGIATQLSGGMDSSSVTATAARLLGEKRLTAFTSVPHADFRNQNPAGRFGDEGPAAVQVAAMYPNIDHVLIEGSGDIIAELERMGRLQGHPVFNPLNELWLNAIMDSARTRGITVMLQGACGNATLSSGGMVGLSQLFNRGRWLKLARLMIQLRKRGHASLRGSATWATGSAIPAWLRRRMSPEIASFDFTFSPVLPKQALAYNLQERAREEFFGGDTSVAGFRKQMFEYYDIGYVNVATTLEWGIEQRDPTQDKRIFEYCFSIPIEQYTVGGQTRSLVRRAMQGRLPAATLERTTRGLQSADWFLKMGACLSAMKAELERIRTSPMANRILDLERMERLLNSWPSEGYELAAVSDSYHLALSRGLSVGNFIRSFE